mgnify:CR=1 FL=1|tara:strand:+ start:252 stop:785 length:534 start_codon:yes stop_codon:yes gene_type:complete
MQYFDNFRAAPPGWSLTQEPGKWDWDRPPMFNTPLEATEFILDRVEVPTTKDRYIKMMIAGISIEEIVNSLAITGFSQGYFNPDVAELIRPSLVFYFIGVADTFNIPVRIFKGTVDGGPPQPAGMSDETLLQLMEKRNPQIYAQYKEQEYQQYMANRQENQGMLAVEPETMIEEEEQ